jgi:LIVCS family branched-chain amino acid:cation transporter
MLYIYIEIKLINVAQGGNDMEKKKNDFVVIGAALFAMFFGAGNLIFPPALGIMSGDKWFMMMVGFALTGVGLPILGILAVAKTDGSFEKFAGKVSPKFAKVLGTVVVLAIGPLLAIPRTGATVYEIGIQPILGDVSPLLVSTIYFAITLFFVINPSSIIDKIGKILTPILLIVISTIIIKGIVSPIGTIVATDLSGPLSTGFVNGYQTMDALASIVLGGLIVMSIKQKGYTSRKDQIKVASKAGVLAGAGLLFIYGGLLYLGATASGTLPADISRTDLIITITNRILGSFGSIGMGFAVSAACLTTSIGLTAVVGSYFEELTYGKLKYRAIVIITTVFSTLMSVVGVDKIVSLAVPLLTLVYPVAIILIIFNLLDEFIPNNNYYRGAIVGALLVSAFDALGTMNINITFANNLIARLPFAASGFGWVLPALIFSLGLGLVGKNESDLAESKLDTAA